MRINKLCIQTPLYKIYKYRHMKRLHCTPARWKTIVFYHIITLYFQVVTVYMMYSSCEGFLWLCLYGSKPNTGQWIPLHTTTTPLGICINFMAQQEAIIYLTSDVFKYVFNNNVFWMILTYTNTLTGMFGILVIGSILSTEPMETSGIQRAHATCAHFCPDFVDFIAPPVKSRTDILALHQL